MSLDEAVISTPLGVLVFEADENALRGIRFVLDEIDLIQPQTPLLKEACRQMLAYFDDPHFSFDLPLHQKGSVFARRVWDALREIPVGSAKTYGQLALQLNTGPRALANACKANEFPIIIPCHRVLSASGIGGYCGHIQGPFIEIKRKLLALESYEFA